MANVATSSELGIELFISHSSRDQGLLELVKKRIESFGFRAYLAEYDIAGIGHELSPKMQEAIKASAAVVVVLTKNAASSPIVREEIGFAHGLDKLVVPLVTPSVAQSPAALGMLNGREYILFDIDDPQDSLIKLTDWVNMFASQKQEELHKAQLQTKDEHLHDKDEKIVRLQNQNEAAAVLLVFVTAFLVVVLIAKAS
jgi:hypothetical protein